MTEAGFPDGSDKREANRRVPNRFCRPGHVAAPLRLSSTVPSAGPPLLQRSFGEGSREGGSRTQESYSEPAIQYSTRLAGSSTSPTRCGGGRGVWVADRDQRRR